MKLLMLVVSLSMFVESGVANCQELYEKKDKFDGTTHYFTSDRQVKLEGGSFFTMRYVNFSFHAFSPTATKDVPYYLHVNTSTPDWIFISSGASLVLKLDGEQMLALNGPGSSSSREVMAADTLLESASYLVSEEQLQRIGAAKAVEFRILGDRQNVTGTWNAKLIADAASLAAKGPGLIAVVAPEGSVLVNSLATTGPPQPCPAPKSPATGAAPAKLGVRFVPTPKQFADTFHMPEVSGVLVATVVIGSVAEASGIQVGDVILTIGGKTVAVACDLTEFLAATPPGTKVSIGLWHNGANSEVQAQF